VTAAAPEPGQSAARRTGLVVWVQEAETLVAPFRLRFHADAVARRIVPHVTVLFPFVTAVGLDEELRAQLATHFAAIPAFDASLDGIRRFDAHVWLSPAPRERFVDLIRATCARFPELPPYEGLHDESEPHLTIGSATEGTTTEAILEAARELEPALPLAFRVDAVWLLEELHDGTWALSARFALA
jgi:2'-5' RNA ligase